MKNLSKLTQLPLILTCLFLATNITTAQTIKWGTKNKSTFFTSQFLPEILGEDDENFYTYSKHGGTSVFALEAYNKKTGNQVYTIEFNAGKKDRRVRLKKALLTNGKILIFITDFSNKNNKNEIYVRVYDAKTGKLNKNRVDLFSEETDENYVKTGRFSAYLSPDKSKILINYYAFDTKRNKFYDKFILFSEDLEEITRRENTYDDKYGDMSSHYTLDNSGNLYFLKRGDDLANFIVSYDVENDYEKWEEKIRLNNLDIDISSLITDIKLKINQNNELIIYGIYCKTSPESYGGNPKGAFDGYLYIKIDKHSKEIIAETLSTLEPKLIESIKSNMGKHKKYFNLNIISLSNGESILSSEFSVKLPNGSKSKVRYTDLIITKLKSTGEIAWSLRIPKRQQYTASNLQLPRYHRPYYKFKTFADLTHVYVLFNDNEKNNFSISETFEMKSMNNPNASKISIYSIDINTGQFKTSSSIENKEIGVAMMATRSFQNSQESAAYIFGKNGKKYTFGIFSK